MFDPRYVKVFNKAFTTPVFIVANADSYAPYVEHPAEADDPYNETDYIVRVFTTKDEVLSYVSKLQQYNDFDFTVLEVPWDLLIQFILNNADYDTKSHMRIELSSFDHKDWPKVIDTIWATNAVIN